MRKRGFVSSLSIITICFLVFSMAASADTVRPRPDFPDRPVRPDIGSGGSSQTAATVIIKCAAGTGDQIQVGDTGSQSGNCTCRQTGNGSSSCSCTANTQGSGTPPTSGGSGLYVKGIYASADFPAETLDDITNAESCADAVHLLQTGSSSRSSADCQFSVDSNPWYSCKL